MKNTFNDEDLRRIDQYYKLVPNPNNVEDANDICVQINTGLFEGTILKFGKINLKADEDDELTANYEYDILYVPDEKQNEDYTDEQGEEFESMIGEILMGFIYKQFKDKEEHGQDRESNNITFSTL